jgi:hypothetical protein
MDFHGLAADVPELLSFPCDDEKYHDVVWE